MRRSSTSNPRTQQVQAILTALRHLAARCDGARQQDGQGFNKYDSERGRELAGKDDLKHGEKMEALRIVRKYRKQIPDDMWEALPSESRPVKVSNTSNAAGTEPRTPFDSPGKRAGGSGGKAGGFKRNRALTLDSPMPFGKWKGETFRDLALDHTDYVRYCLENFDEGKQDILDVMELAMEDAGYDF